MAKYMYKRPYKTPKSNKNITKIAYRINNIKTIKHHNVFLKYLQEKEGIIPL